ncbi:MAG: ABC transporter permease [Anaerolineales bacterium]|nr:ABC transporter permease [Anaerolineales bacterium]
MTFNYDSDSSRSPALAEFVELWRYRDFLQLLLTNSIKTRYKRSALGVLWTLLNPLLNTAVLTIALSQLMRFEVGNYPVYLLVGYLVWTFFTQTTTQAMNTLIWGSNLIKRIYIPRTAFAISVTGNGLLNIVLSLIPIFIVMLIMSHPVSRAILLLPFVILVFALFTLGLSLLLSAIAVFFVDMVDLYSVILQAIFFLTPIIYPLSIVPERFLPFFYLNPLVLYLGLFREILYEARVPSIESLISATLVAAVTFVVGWWLFTKRADEFAYRI